MTGLMADRRFMTASRRLGARMRLPHNYRNSGNLKPMFLLVLAAAAIRLFQSCIDLQVQWLAAA